MARTEDLWQEGVGGQHIEPIQPLGFNILIKGTNRYINFFAISGETGYGFRDNAGVLEFKDDGGSWAPFGAGGGGTPGGVSGDIQYNNAGAFGGFGNWDGTTLDLIGSKLRVDELLDFASGAAMIDIVSGGVLYDNENPHKISIHLSNRSLNDSAGNMALGYGSPGVFYIGDDGSTIDFTGLTTIRVFTLPDKSGTFAMLSDVESFESVSKNIKAYPYVVTYTGGGDVDYITYDLGGGMSIIKTFSYSSGNVSTIVLSDDTPAGISLTKTFTYDVNDNVDNVVYS